MSLRILPQEPTYHKNMKIFLIFSSKSAIVLVFTSQFVIHVELISACAKRQRPKFIFSVCLIAPSISLPKTPSFPLNVPALWFHHIIIQERKCAFLEYLFFHSFYRWFYTNIAPSFVILFKKVFWNRITSWVLWISTYILKPVYQLSSQKEGGKANLVGFTGIESA